MPSCMSMVARGALSMAFFSMISCSVKMQRRKARLHLECSVASANRLRDSRPARACRPARRPPLEYMATSGSGWRLVPAVCWNFLTMDKSEQWRRRFSWALPADSSQVTFLQTASRTHEATRLSLKERDYLGRTFRLRHLISLTWKRERRIRLCPWRAASRDLHWHTNPWFVERTSAQAREFWSNSGRSAALWSGQALPIYYLLTAVMKLSFSPPAPLGP